MKRFVVAVLIVFPILVIAQTRLNDTIIQLGEIEITGTRTGLSLAGNLSEIIDSVKLTRSSNIGEALDNMMQIQVKTTGVSGSSSLYLRGITSVHNAVFWNGFNLAFGSLGSTDLSLIPSVLFDRAAVNYGGAASQFGSGVVGGSVNLNNFLAYDKGVKAALALGKSSFNNYSVSSRAGFSNQKLAVTLAASLALNENNFSYRNIYGNRDTLEHARFSQISVLQQAGYKTGRNSEIKAGWWYYKTFRELSPTLLIPGNDQTQRDQAIRGFIEYLFSPGLWSFNLKAYVNDENMLFESARAGIHSDYNLLGSQYEAGMKRITGRFSISAGVQHRRQHARVPAYSENVNESLTALFASVEYTSFSSRFSAGLYARQDLQKDYVIPFCPSLGLKWMPVTKLEIGASLSRNFRLPTLNDRYWIPGGNPDILPENSWNQDISAKFSNKHFNGRLEYFISLSAYNMIIYDLIQWVPVTAAIWSPVNRNKVRSRGISHNSTMKYATGKIIHKLGTSYSFSPSGMIDSKSEQFQLIYVPKHKANAEYMLMRRNTSVSLQYQLIGKRYTATDNTASLPLLQLADLEISQSFVKKKLTFDLIFTVKNLFNANYQMVAGYPESLRYFNLKLIIHYSKSKDNEN